MKWLTRWLGSPPPAPIDPALWQALLTRFDGAEVPSSARMLRWRDLTARFLADKAITPAADCALSESDRVLIAMLCCEPVLDLGYGWLRGWHQVIVYPGGFGVRRQHVDEDSGVLHEWDDELAGECWEQGPVILSLEDAIQAVDAPESGYHVVVHEIAHNARPAGRQSRWHAPARRCRLASPRGSPTSSARSTRCGARWTPGAKP